MIDSELGEIQEKFALLVWKNEPIASGDLVRLCEKELNWKKPTTYTVLRKLCEKGLFRNENGTVTSVIGREKFYSEQSERYVKKTFGGSLPAFFAAFTSQKKLSEGEIEEIQKMIDDYRKENQTWKS